MRAVGTALLLAAPLFLVPFPRELASALAGLQSPVPIL
jgi:hypothetical protein